MTSKRAAGAKARWWVLASQLQIPSLPKVMTTMEDDEAVPTQEYGEFVSAALTVGGGEYTLWNYNHSSRA